MMRHLFIAIFVLAAGAANAQVQLQPANAQRPAAQPPAAASETPRAARKERKGAPAGFNSNSKEPISIDADKLEVFDKEQRAVYTGNVVAAQGQSILRCTILVVFYTQQQGGQQKQAAPAQRGAKQEGSKLKKLDCAGPVSVTTKKEDGNIQTATGKNGVFEAAANEVTLTGDVILVDGQNVQRGDKLVYNTDTGVAIVSGGRVSGFFVPGSDSDKKKPDADKKKQSAKPDQKTQ